MDLFPRVPPAQARCTNTACRSLDAIDTKNITRAVCKPGKLPKFVIVGRLRQCARCGELYVVTGEGAYAAPSYLQPRRQVLNLGRDTASDTVDRFDDTELSPDLTDREDA